MWIEYVYAINEFTTVDLGCERGNNAYYAVTRTEATENGRHFLRLFDTIWSDATKLQDVTDYVIESISTCLPREFPGFYLFLHPLPHFNEFLDEHFR